MPHCTVEYSDNLAEEGAIPVLLEAIAGHYAASGGAFPVQGIRVRAHRVSEYVIADGDPDHGFVHLICRIAPGRATEYKERFFGEMFELVKAHFAALMLRRRIGLSLDVDVSAEGASWKLQNLVEVRHG